MRKSKIKTKKTETNIDLSLNLDGYGKYKIKTTIPFIDHMLSLFAKHGLFDLELQAKGDLHVDIHHTNEDIGICLGEAFKKALGKKEGIRRVGECSFPLDEAVTRAVIDLSGRPYLKVRDQSETAKETAKERRVHPVSRTEKYFYSIDDAVDLWRAFTQHAGITCHVWIESGEDAHHIIETFFKAMARALDAASQRDSRVKGVPSTKGSL